MRLLYLTLVCFIIHSLPASAQQLNHRLGYIILQLEKDVQPNRLLKDYTSSFRSNMTVDRQLSKHMGIFLIHFDFAAVHEGKLLDQFRSDNRVLVAQYDHLLKQRVVPDDPEFFEQWQWLNQGQTGGLLDADIDADLAWDITTGGVTALGDTIVVAIVDDGLDYTHEDIVANAWINYHEIADNGVDDDGNGYIDDIHGWNAYDQNNDVFNDRHGLNVAGMIGAQGNNGKGIAGINWNVKIMMIVGGDPESAAIASYAYALDQRKLYEKTNGALGAFVVATNSSWGIDFGQPADAPLWCAFYDTLGHNGILSAAATANNAVDIDLVGDLPTACPSEYLLSVTALDASNQLTFAAWGLSQIDFGAPGDNIYTTRRNNNYGNTSGTSFASPIAAGLVGLLYSAPCQSFAELTHTDPAAAASLIRDVMFGGVKQIPSLIPVIRFGGSLNAANSLHILMALCSDCPYPFNVTATDVTDTEATINWSILDTVQSINVRYRPIAFAEWDTIENVTTPLHLSNLVGCTEYEIELQSVCSDTVTDYQSNYHFTTDGCCVLPAEVVASLDGTTLHLNWTFVLAAEYYLVQFRPVGAAEWFEEVTTETSLSIPELDPCTYYEFRLQTSCDTTETGFSDIQSVLTKGCGNCIDLDYCQNTSQDASGEYIDSLIIGPLVNPSGNNGGYAFFDTINPQYTAGERYSVWLRPGFGGNTFDEQIRIWLDANQNGVFDSTELLVDSVLQNSNPFLLTNMLVPDSALAGSTRMRVSMAYADPFFETNQPPCGTILFGEIEDYCVEILKNPDECPAVDTIFFDAITFTSAFMYWPSIDEAIAYTYRYREVGETEYKEFATVDTTANLSDLAKCKMYEVQIQTVCIFDTAGYHHNFILKTDCDVAVNDPAPLLSSFIIFPNPTADVVNVHMIPLESGKHVISIFDLNGRMIANKEINGTSGHADEIRFEETARLASGLYFVVVEKNGTRTAQRFVKI